MINIRKSPLYNFLKAEIMYNGYRFIGIKKLTKIKDMVDNLLENCCMPRTPRDRSPLVQTAYSMIKQMGDKSDIPKLRYVQAYLDFVLSCCGTVVVP